MMCLISIYLDIDIDSSRTRLRPLPAEVISEIREMIIYTILPPREYWYHRDERTSNQGTPSSSTGMYTCMRCSTLLSYLRTFSSTYAMGFCVDTLRPRQPTTRRVKAMPHALCSIFQFTGAHRGQRIQRSQAQLAIPCQACFYYSP